MSVERRRSLINGEKQHNIAPISTWEEREFPMVFTKVDGWCDHKESTCVEDTRAPSSLQPIFGQSKILTSSTSLTNTAD